MRWMIPHAAAAVLVRREFKTMRFALLPLMLLAATPTIAQSEVGDRDLQWIYRDKHGDGTASPSAIFLSWNYSSVILRAECTGDEYGNAGKAGSGSITLRYYPSPPVISYDENGMYKDQPFDPFSFSRGELNTEFAATVGPQAVVGHIDVTPKLLKILKPGEQPLEIEATNEMEEPWYVGQAEPLYRLALACQKS
jgi:hypothetical protein